MLAFARRKLAGTPGIEWRQADAGALLEKRGADLEAIIAKCAAALARLGGAEPFRCPARALAIEARAA